jgi:hypothetical protein
LRRSNFDGVGSMHFDPSFRLYLKGIHFPLILLDLQQIDSLPHDVRLQDLRKSEFSLSPIPIQVPSLDSEPYNFLTS